MHIKTELADISQGQAPHIFVWSIVGLWPMASSSTCHMEPVACEHLAFNLYFNNDLCTRRWQIQVSTKTGWQHGFNHCVYSTWVDAYRKLVPQTGYATQMIDDALTKQTINIFKILKTKPKLHCQQFIYNWIKHYWYITLFYIRVTVNALCNKMWTRICIHCTAPTTG